ncbi:MAG: hypothetical protein Q8R92_03170 [Deltaproteobacteria bacterium]|nr:hypothetical protein [Deltaproteobacteria bacterium]
MLKKEDIIAQIDARLRGDIDDEELVTWAHQCFLDDDAGENAYDEEWDDVIDDVVYRLQASDEPDKELSEETLKELRQKLIE